MANSASAKKAIKQNEKNRLANKSKKSAIKTALRRVNEAVLKKDVEQGEKTFIEAQSLLAKAAKKGFIHHRKASRLISKSSLKVKKIS
jgi:small subunit ribosomal protein S20